MCLLCRDSGYQTAPLSQRRGEGMERMEPPRGRVARLSQAQDPSPWAGPSAAGSGACSLRGTEAYQTLGAATLVRSSQPSGAGTVVTPISRTRKLRLGEVTSLHQVTGRGVAESV